jgi:hypothetical protein
VCARATGLFRGRTPDEAILGLIVPRQLVSADTRGHWRQAWTLETRLDTGDTLGHWRQAWTLETRVDSGAFRVEFVSENSSVMSAGTKAVGPMLKNKSKIALGK